VVTVSLPHIKDLADETERILIDDVVNLGL